MRSWLARNREVNLYLALAITLTIIIGAMLFALSSATELHDTLYPLADATMELAIEASLAHLHLEQSLVKSDTAELNKAWRHLDRLDKYATAMLEGGTVDGLLFKPVGNAELRHKVTYVRVVIMEYRNTALKRIGVDPASAQGKAYRNVHEAVFKDLLERTAEAEAQFRLQMTSDLRGFKHLQILLIIASLGFSVLAAITFHKYMVDRKRDEQRIKHLNLILRAVRNVSHLITVEKNQLKLIKKTCDLLVETRGFHNAWITLLDEDGKPSVCAEAGLKEAFSVAREILDQGELLPCCDRLKTLEGVLVVEDPPADCANCPLSHMYTGRGGLAVRLEHDKKLYGFMVVSSPHAFIADKEEQRLFEEVAKDIAMSLHLLSTEEQRLRMERALRESETRYRLLADNATDVIWAVDKNMRFTYVSPSVTRLRGFSVGEAMGQRLEEVVTRNSLELARQAIAQGLWPQSQGRDNLAEWQIVELEMVCRNGNTVYTETSLSPLRDSDGNVTELLGVTRDISERKHAERTIKDSETRYRALFESAGDGIFLMDRDRFIDCNARAQQMFGCTRDALIGSSPLQFCSRPRPDSSDSEEVFKNHMDCAWNGQPQFFEWRLVSGDGAVLDVEINLNRIDTGRTQCLLAIVRDVTDRKKTAGDLAASEKKYRTLAEGLQQLIYRMPLEDPHQVYVNPAAETIYGYAPPEWMRNPDLWYECIHPDDAERVTKAFNDFVAAGGQAVEEYRIIAKDGTVRWVEDRVRTEKDESGKVFAVSGIVTDITERKKASEKLRQTTALLQSIMDSSTEECIIATDPGGLILSWNEGAKRLLGYDADEVVGTKSIGIFCTDEYVRSGAIEKSIETMISTGVPIAEGMTYVAKDGRQFPVHQIFTPRFSEDGQCIGFLGLARDVTVEKQAAQEIARYTKELERTNLELKEKKGELEEFIYTVSHDLKAPIVSISGFAGLIKQRSLKEVDQTTTKYLQRIAVNAEVMENLISDLLELSRIGRSNKERVMVNVNEVVQEIFESLSVVAAKKNITLSVIGTLPEAYGWLARIRQLLTNLIDNAIKYMPEGANGHVRVGFDPDIANPNGRQGAFFVSDNGEGIPKEFQHRLFKAFQRIQHNGGGAEGSGVGLSIVKRIAEAHGGQVWFESEPGVGSTFYFSLPLIGEVNLPPVVTGSDAGEKTSRRS